MCIKIQKLCVVIKLTIVYVVRHISIFYIYFLLFKVKIKKVFFHFSIFIKNCALDFPVFLVSRQLAEKRPKESPLFVRSFITQFLENRSLLFSETLHLSRTWIGDKNVPSGFLKKLLISSNPL